MIKVFVTSFIGLDINLSPTKLMRQLLVLMLFYLNTMVIIKNYQNVAVLI